jgi:integrase
MRRVRLTQTLIQKAEPREARYTLYDETPGLMLRVEPSGNKIYYIDYSRDGKRSSKKLGSADILTVAQAREATKEFLARVALGEDVGKKKDSATLREIIDAHYAPWVLANRKSGEYSLRILRNAFTEWFDIPTQNITIISIEKWSLGRKARAATLNRQTAVLKAVLNWAVKRDIIEVNPLIRLEQLQQSDSISKVRYLSPEERGRLMTALDECSDYLSAMVIISLHTGIRQGALFSLLWSDVDLDKKILTLRDEDAKNNKLNYVPINNAALQAFVGLDRKSSLVFPSPKTGDKIDNCRKAWRKLLEIADIKNFRWHDMRHDFASQLVMKGVDLNTVRELLGHSDIKMTLRYAHLAPGVKAKAVAVLE